MVQKNDGELKLQGMLVVADSGEEDGGFCCVPGFHKKIEEWARLTCDTEICKDCENKYDLVSVPEGRLFFFSDVNVKEDSLHQHLQKITARAGSLIIWRGELVHCNYPNSSDKFRMVQYLKMFPQRVRI